MKPCISVERGTEKTPCTPCNQPSGRVFWKQTRTATARDRVQRAQRTPPPCAAAVPPPSDRIPNRNFTAALPHEGWGSRKRTQAHVMPIHQAARTAPCIAPQTPSKAAINAAFCRPESASNGTRLGCKHPSARLCATPTPVMRLPPPRKSSGAWDARPQASIHARFFPHAEDFYEVKP